VVSLASLDREMVNSTVDTQVREAVTLNTRRAVDTSVMVIGNTTGAAVVALATCVRWIVKLGTDGGNESCAPTTRRHAR
jgi:cysteine synthase